MIGSRVAHYEIQEPLGKGAMGEVYRARDTKLDRLVALKVMPESTASDAELLHRFQREAKALAALDHPNIVAVHSVDEHDGRQFLTMGLVEGRSLDGHIPRGGMTAKKWLDFTRAIAEGLAAAHAKGVIHRDLKPANIMVTPAGKVKLVDFGLARLKQEEGDAEASRCVTRSGVAVGTIPYMSPEQLKGRPVDARSDIFSLGIVLYEMATGRRPFAGEASAEVMAAILNDNPHPPTGAAVEEAPIIEHILCRCLPKDPDDRYPSISQLLRELDSPEDAAALPTGVHEYTLRDAPQEPLVDMPLPSRPSVAILPFASLSGQADDQHLADGLWFDLHAELVKLSGLFLVASPTMATYRGRTADPRSIGAELRVRHILEGAVRRAGDRVRLTVQLLEAETGQPVWAERYDRDIDELFALQDEVNAKILAALDVNLLHGEASVVMANEFRDRRARELYYQAIPLVFSPRRDDLVRARRLLAEAEEIEPGTWLVPTHQGWSYYTETINGLAEDLAGTMSRADEYAASAIERGDPGGLAYMLRATLLVRRGEHAAARGAAEVALTRRSGCPWIYALLGNIYNYTGDPQRGIEFAAMSYRLSPFTPHLFPAVLATSYYLTGQMDNAVAAAKRALELDAESIDAYIVLAAVCGSTGRTKDGAQATAEIRRLKPNFSLEAFAESQPYEDPAVRSKLIQDLLDAGLEDDRRTPDIP